MNKQKRRQRSADRKDSDRQATSSLLPLIVLAGLSAVIYGIITWLSFKFDFYSEATERPIIAVLLLFALAFACYLIAIRFAARANQNPRLVWVIVAAAVVFRLTMLFSVPIQEVDIYRYMWDGAVATQGVSPFRYPPDQVLAANADDPTDRQLQRLAILRNENASIAEVLNRVHFRDLPTIYPPTSQAVFYFAALTTPGDASVATRGRIMKAWLICFDLGTLFLVIKLLRVCRLPTGLSIIYAWCPLVLKEIANSGHLDAIAVFLTTLAVYLVARTLKSGKENGTSAVERTTDEPFPASELSEKPETKSPKVLATFATKRISTAVRLSISSSLIIASIILAAAVGAKLYPIVLAPLILFGVASRFGWRSVVLPALAFSAVTFLLLLPIMPSASKTPSAQLPSSPSATELAPPIETDSFDVAQVTENISTDENASTLPENDPSLGVTTFLKYWEMNDFIFMVLIENLKPSALQKDNPPVWFSVAPESFRQSVIHFGINTVSIPTNEAPFLITRLVTTLLFIAIAIRLAWRASKHPSKTAFCEAGFLTLAWFWLLLPTQNPWYWLWAMPLLPFVRNRAWPAVSGLVLVYYLRFWFDYHFKHQSVLGTPYEGTAFFDFVVTWIEYAPWFVWLAAEYVLQTKSRLSRSH